ncbi:MAG: hypothetical protein JW727_04865 [Candidatus Aenigmarchaeota archaeon]|nr:hypothetical protein [Candidatus Aenigmarchaeota archaeon]
MDLIALLQNTLYFFVASGIIALLIKSLIKLYLDKDLEAYKEKLKQETIRYSKLHEKRADAIEELFEKLVDYKNYAEGVKWAKESNISGKELKEIEENFRIAHRTFLDCLNKKGNLYFGGKTPELLEALHFEIMRTKTHTEAKCKDGKNMDFTSLKNILEDIKNAEKAVANSEKELINEFQTILGVKN